MLEIKRLDYLGGALMTTTTLQYICYNGVINCWYWRTSSSECVMIIVGQRDWGISFFVLYGVFNALQSRWTWQSISPDWRVGLKCCYVWEESCLVLRILLQEKTRTKRTTKGTQFPIWTEVVRTHIQSNHFHSLPVSLQTTNHCQFGAFKWQSGAPKMLYRFWH